MAAKGRGPARGPSARPVRVGQAMRARLSELLLRGAVKDPRLPALTGVSSVDVSPDLRHARVRINVPGADAPGRQCAIEALSSAKGRLRGELARALHLRYAPELSFVSDTELDDRTHVEQVLEELRREREARQAESARPVEEAGGPAQAGDADSAASPRTGGPGQSDGEAP